MTASPIQSTYVKYVSIMVPAVALLLTLFARSDDVGKGAIAALTASPIQSTYIKYVRVMGFGGRLALDPFCSL